MRADETADTMDLGPCPDCGRRNPPDAKFCAGCGQMTGAVGEGHEAIADPLIGRIVADRYRITELLGRGGMGVVYKVEHVHIGKLMAMKLLHGELARDTNTVKRFQREAEAVSRLNHPNTVQVFDFGRSEGMMYLVMEYLEGQDLGDVIRAAGHLSFERVARLVIQVCSSVAEAHARGIVHRDLKPENIMVLPRHGGSEVAKVLDFGLAKLRDQASNMSVTRAGAIVGTPYYMPPEQIRGEQVDARGDVYAIGAVLYKACTGVPPFVAKTPMGVLTKHLTEPLVLPSQRSGFHLPPMADRIVARAMAKDADDRYQSCDELRQALVDCLGQEGAEMTDPALRLKSGVSAAPADRATRAEVEGYERRLRRRGAAWTVILFMLLAGLGAGAVLLYQKFASGVEETATEEHEPNATPIEANELPMSAEVTGFLGRRESDTIGDVDFYRIDVPREALLNLRITGLPNIDLVIDLYREGQTEPILSLNGAPTGRGERAAGFPVEARAYLIRVHERWIAGVPPMENISDRYTIRWSLDEQVEQGSESEINDSLGRADTLAMGQSVEGAFGWSGDLDVYCIEAEAQGAVQLQVSGVPGIDIVMRPVQRELSRSQIVDNAAEGEGESVVMPATGLCVELSAKRQDGLAPAAPDTPYRLTAEVSTEPIPEPEL